MISLLIGIVVGGFIVGLLGRLVVPGRQQMGFGRTTLLGIAGSFIGGIIGRLVLGWHYYASGLLAFVFAVLTTAVIIAFADRSRRRRAGVG